MTLREKAQHFKPYELENILDEICTDDWWSWIGNETDKLENLVAVEAP